MKGHRNQAKAKQDRTVATRRIRRTRDASIIHEDGRVLFFSLKRFIKDIATGPCCFICGANPATSAFNDEHVLPDWLLRIFKLHDRRITLPNLVNFSYGRYKVPCCVTCNSTMGQLIEIPVSNIVAGGFDSVREHLDEKGPVLLFTWMVLLFLKTHLRDRAFRVHKDPRKGKAKIADWHAWDQLHHVQCVARSFYTEAAWGHGVLGSLVLLKARTDLGDDLFDYADLSAAQTNLVRINDICVIAVMNDGGLTLPLLRRFHMPRIDAPPAGVQLRELMARFALANIRLLTRPVFKTAIQPEGFVSIAADLPLQPRVRPTRKKEDGKILSAALQPFLEHMLDRDGKPLAERVRQGEVSFLYDAEGRFIREPFVPLSALLQRT